MKTVSSRNLKDDVAESKDGSLRIVEEASKELDLGASLGDNLRVGETVLLRDPAPDSQKGPALGSADDVKTTRKPVRVQTFSGGTATDKAADGASGEPEPEKKTNTWLWVGGGALALLLLLGAK